MTDWVLRLLPHRHCYLGDHLIESLQVSGDILIGIPYTILFIFVARHYISSHVVLALGVFVGFCGVSHYLSAITNYWPIYYVQIAVKFLTVLASWYFVYLIAFRKARLIGVLKIEPDR